MFRPHLLALAFLTTAFATTARAQVNLGGAVSDSTTGPLLSGVVYHVASGISVAPGQTLTAQPGAIVKFGTNAVFEISGTLLVNGTGGNPVYFTELRDDSVGGDTNGDGATSPAPGTWIYMRFYGTSGASVINHATVRYGGGFGWSPVRLESSLTLLNSIVEKCTSGGIGLGGTQIQPTISGCTIRNNVGAAIYGNRFDSLANFANNRATGNTLNIVQVENPTLSQDVTIRATAGIDGVITVTGSTPGVPGGRTLTLEPGVIVKLAQTALFGIDGTLIANGTATRPVVFTTFADDAYGGDSNNDGVSSGAPGAWIGLRFYAGSSASQLVHALVRYGGANGFAGMNFSASNATVTSSIVELCNTAAISLESSSARPNISHCTLRNNNGPAIHLAQIGAAQFITRNTATGNTLNQFNVSVGTVTEDTYLDSNTGFNGVLVMSGGVWIPGGLTLTLGPGVAFKLSSASAVDVNGSLVVHGTETAPVIFTDRRDDSVGGDSDGAGGAPAPGGWFRLYCQTWATNVDAEYLTLRYSGLNGFESVISQSSTVALRHVRVERAGGTAFRFLNAGRAEFLTAWSCAGAGISLEGGAFDLRHATVNGATTGILKSGALWTGTVIDSIAWGNTTDFGGLAGGQVRFSDPFAGGIGNLGTDPLFVNAFNGDLHLQAGSACIGTGDQLSVVDSDCTRTDMGAYPALGSSAPSTYCTGKINSAGCTPFLASSGFASPSSGLPFPVRAYNVINNKNGLFFYGLNGRLAGAFQNGLKCVADPVRRLPILSSNGNPGANDCSGVFEYDFNALIQSGSDPLLLSGATVDVQCWYRDPGVQSATGLSNGLEFSICN